MSTSSLFVGAMLCLAMFACVESRVISDPHVSFIEHADHFGLGLKSEESSRLASVVPAAPAVVAHNSKPDPVVKPRSVCFFRVCYPREGAGADSAQRRRAGAAPACGLFADFKMAEDFSTLSHVSPLLTDERVGEALSNWFKQPVTFTHWEYISETGKGDSYLSQLIRIKIHGEAGTGPTHLQVILKNIPKSLSRRLTYRSDEFFKNEINFYEKVLPALLKFQSKKTVKDPFDKYAKLVFAFTDGIHDVLCLEDASLDNFGSAVRQEGIDWAHCKLSFKVLAQFHALSFAMKDQEPEKFNKIKDEVFETYYHERLWPWYERFWKRVCGIAVDAVEKEYPNSIYVEKVKQICVPETYKRMIDAATNTLSTGVISHGDCWTNNFLFKYDDATPIDAKIIDFQLSRCASPVLDISFMIYACTTQDLRDRHYNELLKYYYDVLSTQIREMGSDPDKVYSWDLFMSEIKRYSYFGLAFSFESTPFIVLAPEDAVNLEMEMAEDFSTLSHVSPLLTDERVGEALSNWFKQPVTFTHWEGDSYLSELIRIKIHGQAETGPTHLQVILKNIPRSLSRRLTYRSDEFFKNEINFYEKVLPALLKFQSKKTVKDPFDKYAKLVFAFTDGIHDVICLEDASLENFGSAVRQEGIDLTHCKLSFKVLAQFHALSFAMKDQEPELFSQIKDELFETYYHERLWPWYERFWERVGGIAVDAVEKEYPNSIYVEKVKQFCVPETYKRMIDAATNTLSTGVISHGDCWTNNFLFKYDDATPIDAKIIDFQLSRCASPVLDLSFMVYACTTQDLRDRHYDELLKYYYDVLSTQIREMGSDPDKVYSWDLFMSEIKRYSYFGLAFSFESTPFIVLAPEDAVNMEMEGDQKLNIDD
ncbi:putative Juvenile hormone-inducible protein, partial [Operophtera brumata]